MSTVFYDAGALDLALRDALNYARSFPPSGMAASYIPELAKADTGRMGACIVTMDGVCTGAGDWQQEFTIQSISKTVSLILALTAAGYDRVFGKVGIEPTGDAFNSLVELETKTPYPLNPMINAGAIVVADYCLDEGGFEAFLTLLRRLCRRDTISINEAVYDSERKTGDRNRSIAYLLRSDGVLEHAPEETLELYFKMCSVNVTAQDLAVFAAMLAGNGIDPVSGERIIAGRIARTVKTLMMTCGMYDASGRFAMRVGMPAKSGVGGGIMACAEGRLGVAAYSPALDRQGNSIAAVHILEYLSDCLRLHYFSGDPA